MTILTGDGYTVAYELDAANGAYRGDPLVTITDVPLALAFHRVLFPDGEPLEEGEEPFNAAREIERGGFLWNVQEGEEISKLLAACRTAGRDASVAFAFLKIEEDAYTSEIKSLHDVAILRYLQSSTWATACPCGWQGPVHEGEATAVADAQAHLDGALSDG